MEQISERPLDAAEANALEKRICALRMRPILTLGAAVFLISLIILLLSSLYWESKAIDVLVSAFGISLVLLWLPLWILVSRDSLRNAMAMKGDMKSGRVFVFESPIEEPLRRLKIIRSLIKEHLVYNEQNVPQRLDVLPCSGTVIRANGKMPNVWLKEKILEAVAAPKQQFEALVKQGTPEADVEEAMDLFQRHMSQEELEELAAHIAKLRRLPGSLIFMAVWMLVLTAAIAIYASSGQLKLWVDKYQLQASLMCFITAIIAFRYFRTLKTASLLTQDAGVKILRLLRLRSEFEGSADENDPPVLEYLPISQLGWSVYGKPYPWRLRKSHIPKAKTCR